MVKVGSLNYRHRQVRFTDGRTHSSFSGTLREGVGMGRLQFQLRSRLTRDAYGKKMMVHRTTLWRPFMDEVIRREFVFSLP